MNIELTPSDMEYLEEIQELTSMAGFPPLTLERIARAAIASGLRQECTRLAGVVRQLERGPNLIRRQAC